MPLDGELRKYWIDEISKHQEFETVLTYITLCSLHFAPESISRNKKLKENARPTIFG